MRKIKNGDTLIDGILLFGAHRGEKISELLSGFDTAAYVTGFLCSSDMLPKSFRKDIQEIIDNFNPFSVEEKIQGGMSIKEVVGVDDIPW